MSEEKQQTEQQTKQQAKQQTQASEPPKEESTQPSQAPPPSGEEAAGEGGAEATDVQDILSVIRGPEFFSALMDGRDVSMVYIHREVKNFYGPETAGVEVRPMPITEVAVRPRRIGDLVLNPLPLWEVERSAAVYVPMQGYEAALQRLQQNRGLLILHGKPGTGKRTTAIRLLTHLLRHAPDASLYELNPGLKLTDINSEDWPENAGMILETPSGGGLSGLKAFHIHALYNQLRPEQKNNALIIITTHVPADFPPPYRHLIQPWDLAWPGDVEETQRQVVVRQLRYLLTLSPQPEQDDQVSARLDALGEDPSLQNILRTPLPPAQLATLAEVLLPAVLGTSTVEEALSRFGNYAYEEVKRWFGEGHSPEEETLLVAAAVFHRAPYSAVDEAARDLQNRLLPPQEEAPKEPPRQRGSLFATAPRRDQRLAAIRAHLEKDTWYGHFGEVEEEVVVFDNPAWQEAVVRLVWEFDAYRETILEWLMHYGVHSWHALRTRAAAAIGAWAQEDFSHIEKHVLRDWARSANSDARRSAAQVLGITIWDKRRSGTTSRLLHHWATQKNQPRWQWTAAMAYAGLAGPRFPQQTLADLEVIAGQTLEHPFLMEPLLRAVWNFYAAAATAPDRRLLLMQALEEWSREPRGRLERMERYALRRAALLGFWVMLWPEEDDPVWRMVLTDIGENETIRELSVIITQRSFNFRQPRRIASRDLHPRHMAFEGLYELIQQVGREGGELKQHLITFLKAIRSRLAPHPEEMRRLTFQVQQWRDLTDAAAELAAYLA